MFAYLRVRLALVLMLILPGAASAATITIAWDDNPDSSLTGYMVVYGTSPGNYSTSIDAGNSVSHAIVGLTAGTRYYFAVRSYNSTGAMGQPSNEVNEVAASPTDTTPPTATMTGPAGGAQVGGSVGLSATAADNVAVAGVRFHVDGVAVGVEDTTAPYAFTWNTVGTANGSHTLTAVARDAAGNLGSSAVVTVQVMNDTTLPTATVTSPAAGSQVSASVVVSATATDNVAVAGVSFRLDGVAVAVEDTTAPYTITWNTLGASNGSHALTAVARDTAGNLRTSAVVTVQVLNLPPAPGSGLVAAYGFDEGSGSVTADVSGRGNTGTIAGATWQPGRFGSALQFDGVSNWVTVPASSDVNLTGSLTIEAWVYPTQAAGWKNVVFKEADGEFRGQSYALYSTFDTEGPGGHVLLATQVEAHDPATLVLNRWTHLATTYDGATLRLFVDGVQRRAVPASGPLHVSAGPLRIGGNSTVWGEFYQGLIDEVRLYNRALSSAEVQADMTAPIDRVAPTGAITSPAASATVTGSVVVSATASDNLAVAGVTFRVDGVAVGVEDTTTPYTSTWNTVTASNGPHALTAVARDTAGNLGTSAVVTVQVLNDSTLPTATITAPAAGPQLSGSVVVSATATDNVAVAGVRFRVDGVAVGVEDATAPYSYTWNTAAVSNGAHTLTAVARDAAGNLATSPVVTVQVLNQPPASSGLVAAYGFDEGIGTVTADASGRGNTGTIDGPVWKPGRFGNALEFDGNWVTVAASTDLKLSTSLTIEAWVYPTEAGGFKTVVFKEAPGEIRDQSYALYSTFGAEGPGGHVLLASQMEAHDPTPIALNRWTHLATTYDGSMLRTFVDGIERAAVAATGPINVSDGALRVGGNATSWGEFYKGRIDEVRLYNRALPVAEIQKDLATPVTGWLAAAYSFDEGAGMTVTDDAGRFLTGTLSGATWTAAGRFGSALQFDGADSVTVPDSRWLDLTVGMTLEAWVYPTVGGGMQTVLFKETADGHTFAMYADTGSGPGVHAQSATADTTSTSTLPLPLGAWSHIAATYDGAALRLYVNGVAVSSTPLSSAVVKSSGLLRIGGNAIWGDYFTGVIDEVRIYYRALTAAEIRTDMTTPIR